MLQEFRNVIIKEISNLNLTFTEFDQYTLYDISTFHTIIQKHKPYFHKSKGKERKENNENKHKYLPDIRFVAVFFLLIGSFPLKR